MRHPRKPEEISEEEIEAVANASMNYDLHPDDIILNYKELDEATRVEVAKMAVFLILAVEKARYHQEQRNRKDK